MHPVNAERDPLLRRIERDALIVCGVTSVAAAVASGDRIAAALGVAGGGTLAWISYRGIKGGIDALVAATSRDGEGAGPGDVRDGGGASGLGRGSAWYGLVKFFTRYGILAAVAYVIMARLRLPPVAVIAGASSLVIAIMLEAVRSFRANPRQHL